MCVEFFLVEFRCSKVLYWLYFGAKKATYRETSSCVHTAWLGGTLRGNVHKNTITFCDVLVVLPTQFYAKILLWLYFRDNGRVKEAVGSRGAPVGVGACWILGNGHNQICRKV